jgi:hypothetical protein
LVFKLDLHIGRAIENTGYYAEWFIGKSIFDITLEQPELAGCVRRAIAGESCSQKEQEWGGRYFELVLVFFIYFAMLSCS